MSAERKYTDADVRGDDELRELAYDYLDQYVGDFEPLVRSVEALMTGRLLTTSEVRVVLNCMRHDWNYADKMPTPQATVIQMPDRREVEIVPKSKKENRQPWRDRYVNCDNPEVHRGHQYEANDFTDWFCRGVENGRTSFDIEARPKVAFAVARGGSMIHLLGRSLNFQYAANTHGEGYGTFGAEERYMWGVTGGPKLIVDLACRYPGWIRRPVLLTAQQALEVNDGVFPITLCKHCNKEIMAEVNDREF